jgi:FAD:protein FMN transferase
MNERDTVQRSGPSRREFLALGIGAFVVASVPWAMQRRPAAVRRSIPVMGTIAEVAVVHRDERYAQAAIDAAFAELRSVEEAMSRFRADSDIGRANRGAAAGPIVVSAATAAVVAEALRWANASGGLFDPCLARVSELWDRPRLGSLPAGAALERLAGRKLYRQLELDRQRGQPVLRFAAPEIGLDLGGIAKGFGVDRAVAVLRDWGIRHALVNAGGDLFALGRSPEGDPWEVGVRSPSDPGGLAATLRVEDAAVATSGDYAQYFEHEGRRYHHLLDPATAEPRRSTAHSVTVEAPTCMAADAAATSVFGCSGDEAARILAAGPPGARITHLI